mmetsp:Transcript_26900/g.79847  ORF Transcript_26900/g.79847 Transcript_26900/m.79847 type:complete len:293 (-) Transcript_26900:1385-2263(-)
MFLPGARQHATDALGWQGREALRPDGAGWTADGAVATAAVPGPCHLCLVGSIVTDHEALEALQLILQRVPHAVHKRRQPVPRATKALYLQCTLIAFALQAASLQLKVLYVRLRLRLGLLHLQLPGRQLRRQVLVLLLQYCNLPDHLHSLVGFPLSLRCKRHVDGVTPGRVLTVEGGAARHSILDRSQLALHLCQAALRLAEVACPAITQRLSHSRLFARLLVHCLHLGSVRVRLLLVRRHLLGALLVCLGQRVVGCLCLLSRLESLGLCCIALLGCRRQLALQRADLLVEVA